ncbi:MAG: ParA family protein [Aquabacterium sp.]|nr:ParA family protein [Aquabacterium sp.]
MPVYVVANPKGGAGKSTVATNLAGWLARQGHAVALGDLDRQQSARQWLALRPPQLPAIQALELADGHVLRAPKGCTHLVLDTPAGLHGKRLDVVLKIADRIIVPLQPSPFDMAATHAFLQALAGHKRGGRATSAGHVGLVAMRVKEHTHATQHLHEFLDAVAPAPLNIPITHLRDTQNYAHLAARGLTLFDVAPGRVERDLQQWSPLTQWLQA